MIAHVFCILIKQFSVQAVSYFVLLSIIAVLIRFLAFTAMELSERKTFFAYSIETIFQASLFIMNFLRSRNFFVDELTTRENQFPKIRASVPFTFRSSTVWSRFLKEKRNMFFLAIFIQANEHFLWHVDLFMPKANAMLDESYWFSVSTIAFSVQI